MMLRGPFRYDRGAHVYTVGATYVPGITTILQETGHTDMQWCTQEARRRGQAVHAATLALDLGDDPLPLPEPWRGFLQGWVDFRAQVPCRWQGLEQPKLSRQLGFAGTPDRWGRVKGEPAVVEIKTAMQPARIDWHGYQLAAQDMLIGGPRWVRRRLVVMLLPSGQFRLYEHNDPRDYVRFLEALDQFDSRGDDGEADDNAE